MFTAGLKVPISKRGSESLKTGFQLPLPCSLPRHASWPTAAVLDVSLSSKIMLSSWIPMASRDKATGKCISELTSFADA